MPLALLAAICLAAAELAQLLAVSVGGASLPAVWPLTGVLVAALIPADRARRARLLAAAIGAALFSTIVVHRQPAFTGSALAIAAATDAMAAAWLVRRLAGVPFALNYVSHTWALVVAAGVAPIAGGTIAAALLGTGASLEVARSWWLAEMLGILLATPLVVAAVAGRHEFAADLKSWKAAEMAILLAVAIAMAQSIFGDGLDPLLRVPTYFLPLLMWPVFRFGPGGTSVAVFVVLSIGLWHAAHGEGPFAITGGAPELVLRSQGAGAIAAVSFLLLAGIVAERKRVARENVILVAELQQALAEVKTLQGFIPICAWCNKVRDDAGFWQQIEQYLAKRTDATFSHSICPACAELAKDELPTSTSPHTSY